MSLDLYAKVEPLIGFDDAYEELYNLYLKHIEKLNIDTILDVGCGSGKLLFRLKDFDAIGIDLSLEMVKRSKESGLDVRHIDICQLDEQFDVVLCVADVLNYMNGNELKNFLECISKRLKLNGYFIADINTLYGFEHVAEGTMLRSFEDKFFGVDAQFNDFILESEFTLFELNSDGAYSKEQSTIFQYFHTEESIKELTSLEFISKENVTLFGDEPDKTLMIFRKA